LNYYEELTATKCPVTLEQAKKYLKMEDISKDDSLLSSLIKVATRWGEQYTGRDFHEKTMRLLIDDFSSRIHIDQIKVDSITSVKHLVSDVLTLIDSTTYYLKNNFSNADVVLAYGKSWPANTDIKEHAIEVLYSTKKSIPEDTMEIGILQHVAYLYYNRGECSTESAGFKSGASSTYDPYKIVQI
jgi:uncharacterized phiE125 gp8 family phage protein